MVKFVAGGVAPSLTSRTASARTVALGSASSFTLSVLPCVAAKTPKSCQNTPSADHGYMVPASAGGKDWFTVATDA